MLDNEIVNAPEETPAEMPASSPVSVAEEAPVAAVESPAAKAPKAPAKPVEASTEESTSVRGRRKERIGKVTSDKMEKTVVVENVRQVAHPKYKKYFKKTTKFVAHSENNDAKIGDTVRIMETRPLSKTKRWRVIEVLERAK